MNGDNEFADFDEYAILVKNNELIKTKLENLQLQNSQLRAQVNNLDGEDNMMNKGIFRTPGKLKEKDELDKNSFYLMMVSQAGIIENFLNEKVF